ncbi:MAG: hypothetical protein KGZ74_05860 [Chitinophagaceae bacterium]|nr:hypothetical protein [Chitinophagaceae bacterium]
MKHLLLMLMEIDPNDPPEEGPFYVIERFHKPQFVLDENGNIKSFTTYAEAAAEAAECQYGFVIAF